MAFGTVGKMKFQVIEGCMNAQRYGNLVCQTLLRDEENQICSENWIFRQENAPIHCARVIRTLFQEQEIRVLNWLANSTDLNVRENDIFLGMFTQMKDSMTPQMN